MSTPEAYFLGMVFGLPLLLLLVALVAGYFYREGPEELLDWRPTRSPEKEVELEHGDLEQMLGALNRYRRMRGAPERSLEEVSERAAYLRGQGAV
ncbi:MAG TPA: hypothetical protein VGY13_07645 [Solirubrobacteraceae bacterium]|jgi:hypothetical protein|nr:hypothetical protein [Solirubrobacteraceae bacterium]